MSALTLYDAARRALSEARRIDEVKDIRDKALAMQHYARAARDSQLIDDATEIRIRAERRAGELLRDMAEKGEREAAGRPEKRSQGVTIRLEDIGVSKMQSHRWQKLAALDDAAFEARTALAKKQALASVELTAAERAAEKKERRADREADLGARQAALPEKRYGVIYADPEWRFDVWSRDTGMDRAADNHYPTSTVEAICARGVETIAADDCALFLWATAPMLPEALRVLAAWGFRYVSHFIWKKDRIGTGYWNRNRHELLLVGTRGNIPAPAMGTQWDSVIDAPLGAHSAKPEVFLELIEATFPTLPKIELNRRGPAREGWDAWGNEAVLLLQA